MSQAPKPGLPRSALHRAGVARAKSTDAFRTIGEVSDELDVPKHVLRFWEGKFPQLKPMKRGGGRRFYRPEDVALLRGIHHLLHSAGYTIKGVQKILREQGVDAVKGANPLADAARSDGAAPLLAGADGKRQPSRAARKAPALSPALRTELEALAQEIAAVLSLARGEAPLASAVAAEGAKPRRR
jgi:DNA-binding transcriptional MerR regulator